mgnify:CR=1 FL=1|tara:strand:+ start:10649 stop:11230 length:582 start_codon:yes stop_codon:yes gene_type:complete
MSLSPTVTTTSSGGNISPKTSPDSITTVSYSANPANTSGWTTSAPQVLYQAPSTCKFVRIVIPYAMRNSSSSYSTDSFTIEGGSGNNYWIGLAIVNDTNNTTDNIVRGYHASSSLELRFNNFAANGQYDDPGVSITNPFDVVANYQQSNYNQFFIIHQDRWVLNPGEKFVATTGEGSNMSQNIYANFQAWVYN